MDLRPYQLQIQQEVPALQQVVIAQPITPIKYFDTAAYLVGMLSPVVNNQMFLLTQPPSRSYPNLVYQLVSSVPIMRQGMQVYTSDTYVINLRAENPQSMVDKSQEVIDALWDSAKAWAIMDQMVEYEETPDLYVHNMEMVIHYMPLESQWLPTAMLYGGKQIAQPAELDGCNRQRLERDFYVMLFCREQDDQDLLLQQIRQALLGFQVDPQTGPVLMRQGQEQPEGLDALHAWEDGFFDWVFIQDQ